MTQIIVIGESAPIKRSRPIEFTMQMDASQELGATTYTPDDFKFVELICSNYGENDKSESFDLMFAYDNPEDRGEGVLFIGQFNDGII